MGVIGSVIVNLEARSATFDTSCQKSGGYIKELGERASITQEAFKGLWEGLGIGAGIETVRSLFEAFAGVDGIKKFVELTETIEKAAALRIPPDVLGGLETAAFLKTGQSAQEFDLLLEKMVKDMGEVALQGGPSADALKTIGLNAAQLTALRPDEQFRKIADGLSKITNPAIQAKLATELFGRQGQALLPMFAEGASGIEEAAEKAREWGTAVNEVDSKKILESAEAVRQVQAQFEGAKNQLVIALAPTLEMIAGKISSLIPPADQMKATFTSAIDQTVAGFKYAEQLVEKSGRTVLNLGEIFIAYKAASLSIVAVNAIFRDGQVIITGVRLAMGLLTTAQASEAVAAGTAGAAMDAEAVSAGALATAMGVATAGISVAVGLVALFIEKLIQGRAEMNRFGTAADQMNIAKGQSIDARAHEAAMQIKEAQEDFASALKSNDLSGEISAQSQLVQGIKEGLSAWEDGQKLIDSMGVKDQAVLTRYKNTIGIISSALQEAKAKLADLNKQMSAPVSVDTDSLIKAQDAIAKLQQQVNTFGESQAQKTVDGFRALGVDPAVISQLQQLAGTLDQLDKNKKATDELARFNEEIATFGKSASQKAIDGFKALGVDPAIVGQLQKAADAMDKLEAKKKEFDEAASAAKSVQTPQEKFDEYLKKWQKWLYDKAITWDQYNRLIAKGQRDLQDSLGKTSDAMDKTAQKHLTAPNLSRRFDFRGPDWRDSHDSHQRLAHRPAAHKPTAKDKTDKIAQTLDTHTAIFNRQAADISEIYRFQREANENADIVVDV